MASLFISHASPDRAFALRLMRSLEQLGHIVWIDVPEIQVGDSIPKAVATAVERADYLVMVLSKNTAASSWCEHEWYAKYWDEVVSRQIMVLPALLDDCVIPFFLRSKRHADFRSDYAVGLAQLALALRDETRSQVRCRGDDRCLHHVEAVEGHRGLPSTVASRSPVCYTQDTMKQFGRLEEINVELTIPYIGKIAGTWKPDEREQNAAWEMYVELVTRISVAELAPGEGLLRESLTSLYGIFTTTRTILRSYGPAVARPKQDSALSFGYLSISILNYALRPVLAKWHPLLLDYEHGRDTAVSPLEHERSWEKAEELRIVLNQVRLVLLDYTKLLAQISRVPITLPEA